MAKQIGDIILVGTIDDITFYEMDGKGYARHKSSLTGKRVKKDPRFKRTMQSAHRLGRGSQLASKVYRSLPRQEQVYGLFKELKHIAILAIKDEKSEDEVMALLQKRMGKAKDATKTKAKINKPDLSRPTAPGKKTPGLFRVHGGRVNEVRRPGRKGKRLGRQACHLRPNNTNQQQRE